MFELEQAGYPVEAALPVAMRKDGGLTPAQLAWILSQVRIPDGAKVPGRRPAREVREYLEQLVERLTRLARPG